MSKNLIVQSEKYSTIDSSDMEEVNNTTKELNIKLVQKIEKYLVLYDRIIECYSSENDVDEAWKEVADYIGLSVSECKQKWKEICQALKRNIQENENASRKNAGYNYLMPHLKFMMPFVKKNNTPKFSEERINDETEDMEDLHSLREAKQRQKQDTNFNNSMKYENNADMSFLRSLLPDLELMNTRQKQKFKIGVLNLMNDILEQNENDYELESNSNKISVISEQEYVIKEEDT